MLYDYGTIINNDIEYCLILRHSYPNLIYTLRLFCTSGDLDPTKSLNASKTGLRSLEREKTPWCKADA